MGVYLSTPIKEKHSSDSENANLKCGASSMQGWRTSQEDAHNCCLDFDTNISLFAVYDGHGGHEVAKYASDELPNLIKTLESYQKGEYEAALRESFLRFDATLKETEVAEILKKIAKEAKDKSDAEEDEIEDEDENDLKNLKNEANMPLTEVLLTNYTGIQKTPASKRLNLGESSKSPFLRAKTSSSADTEVSSSSSSSSKEPTTNGIAESNGVAKKSDVESAVSSTSAVTNGDEAVDSTSEAGSHSGNTEEKPESCDSSSGPTKAERLSKKKAKRIVLNALLNELDSYDSDESDSSFDAGERTVSSDDDDDDSKLNGSKIDEEDDSDEEVEEEEDDDEDEDEDDEEEADICANEEPGVDSGCTAVVALVTSDKLFVANAGDSRAVLSRKGEAIDMSVDHKPEDAPELKRILAAGGDVTNGRVNGGLNLSRALGDHFYKRSEKVDATEQMITALPDIKIEDLKPEDEFMVLACDGIWNSMTSQEVVNFVRPRLAKGEKPSYICEQLFEKCLAPNTLGDGTGCDNMTCVIVQFMSNKIEIDENSEEKSENTRPRDETSEDADSGIPLAKKARVES